MGSQIVVFGLWYLDLSPFTCHVCCVCSCQNCCCFGLFRIPWTLPEVAMGYTCRDVCLWKHLGWGLTAWFRFLLIAELPLPYKTSKDWILCFQTVWRTRVLTWGLGFQRCWVPISWDGIFSDPWGVLTGLTGWLRKCFEGKPEQGKPLSQHRAAQEARAVPLPAPAGSSSHCQLSLVILGKAAEQSWLQCGMRKNAGLPKGPYHWFIFILCRPSSAKQKPGRWACASSWPAFGILLN